MKRNLAKIGNYLWKVSLQNLNKVLSPEELKMFNSNDYYYLTVISQREKTKPSDLARDLNLTRPAISAMIRKFLKLEIIEKVQGMKDKRIFYVSLTEKGQKIIDGDNELFENLDKLIKCSSKSDEEYKVIERVLDSIIDYLGDNHE